MTEPTRWSKRPVILSMVITIMLAHAGGAQISPYAGVADRDIKALSEEQRAAYLRGDGMGLALAAELHGLPGPKHVLELADSLGLSTDQRVRTAALFESMRAAAAALGAAIVAAEERLDRWFRDGGTDTEELAAFTTEIGALQGQLRFAHLAAHVTMLNILTDEQRPRYGELRGYATDQPTLHRHEH